MAMGALCSAQLPGAVSLSLAPLISVERLSIGTATALQVLGPLSIAVIRLSLALTEPWHGESDLHGILLALAAGLC
jgi:inner membrane transporter RhtA